MTSVTPSFRDWLHGHIEDETPTGDVAREAADDACAEGETYQELARHMAEAHGAEDAPRKAAAEAYEHYLRETGQSAESPRI